MPILKGKHDYMKFYRPNGTKYTSGPTVASAARAVEEAQNAFFREHGYSPRDIHTNIEVLGVTGGYVATVLEIKD